MTASSPAQLATALLAEWGQCTSLYWPAAYHLASPVLLVRLTDFCRVLKEPADTNVDIDDLRAALLPYSSLRLGLAQASGNGRALQLAQDALADTDQWQLGPTPTVQVSHLLLLIENHPMAELEMGELTSITEYLQRQIGNLQATVVFSHVLQPQLPMELRLHLLISYGQPLFVLPKQPPPVTLRPEEVFPAAVRLLTEHQAVSGSLLQYHLGLGYNRTCQLLEELVAAEIIRWEDGGFEVIIN